MPSSNAGLPGRGMIGAAICAAALLLGIGTAAADQGKGTKDMSAALDTVTFGAGCFWCVEAVFQNLDGVKSVVSGYSGGNVPDPSYEDVCTGTTGHAEVCQITYDPK